MTIMRGLLLASLPALIATAPAPLYFTGYRSLQFGLTGQEISDRLVSDFKVDRARITVIGDKDNGTQAIAALVPGLAPGPGPALVTAILGATSHRLTHINLEWADAAPTADRRRAFVDAAHTLALAMRARPEQPAALTLDRVVGANAAVPYFARDADGAGMEIALQGVDIRDAKGAILHPATGPVLLRVAISLNVTHPDVRAPVAVK